MLSHDLEMFVQALAARKKKNGEVVLDPNLAAIAEIALSDCISQARHLEAAQVRQQPTIIDLSDPKIELFPVVKRPIPIRKPDDGGAA